MNSAKISSSLSLRADGLSLSKDSDFKIRIKKDLTDSGVLCSTYNDMPVELASPKTPEPNERLLSPLGEAEEAKRLIADFRAGHPDLTSFHQEGIRLLWEESASRTSLRVSRTTDEGVESIILVIDEERGGGIHHIKTSSFSWSEVHAHTPTAVGKVRKFLQSL